jgi:hypothetical protein
MRLAEADVADQDDVGLGCDEGQAKQVLDLWTCAAEARKGVRD